MKRKSWQKKRAHKTNRERKRKRKGERGSAEKRKADRQRRNWRPQMKGEIGLVFACEFPHRKSTSCHRGSMNGGARRSCSRQGSRRGEAAEGGRQADGRQTLGKFPPPTHAHIEGVCVCVCGSRECRVWVEVVPGRREEGGGATVGRQH